MKKIQNFYLYSYRLVGFVFLVGLILSILWYGFSMLFFVSNSSWSVPMILSPNQENVMTHLEHVLGLEHEVSKNRAQLKSLKQALGQKKKVLEATVDVFDRIEKTMVSQSKQYTKNSQIFKSLSKEKTANIDELFKLVSQIQKSEVVIDNELKIGLITKQEALSAHLKLSTMRSVLVDAKANKQNFKQQSLDFANAASTLNGSTNNLQAMEKIVHKVELESHIAQIKSDIYSLRVSTKQLNRAIKEKTQVLALLTNSPYIRATKNPTTVAFVPYRNLTHAKVGAPVYSCFLDMIFCYQSGRILRVYNAEEYSTHPIFKSEIKGQLIGIAFNDETDGQKKLLFLNSKPLLL